MSHWWSGICAVIPFTVWKFFKIVGEPQLGSQIFCAMWSEYWVMNIQTSAFSCSMGLVQIPSGRKGWLFRTNGFQLCLVEWGSNNLLNPFEERSKVCIHTIDNVLLQYRTNCLRNIRYCCTFPCEHAARYGWSQIPNRVSCSWMSMPTLQICIQHWSGAKLTQEATGQSSDQYLYSFDGYRNIHYKVRMCKTRASVTGGVGYWG